MFSVYKFDKEQKDKTLRDRRIKKYDIDEKIRRESLDKLCENYRKRIENFVVNMTENPVITSDNTNFVLRIRDDEPDKNLGPPCFKFTETKPVRDRSKEILKESTSQPIVKYKPFLHTFRPRYQDKEIQPKMRFTADAVERITDNLNGMMRSMIDKADPDPKLSESFLEEISRSPVAVKKYIAKHIMPSLHRKTHFKAATSFVLRYKDTLRDKDDAQEAPKKSDEKQATEDKLLTGKGLREDSEEVQSPTTKIKVQKLERHKDMERRASFIDDESPSRRRKVDPRKKPEYVDPFKISRDVLIRCNFMRKRNPSVPVLRKGEGRNFSVPDLTNRELYQSLYRKSVESSSVFDKLIR